MHTPCVVRAGFLAPLFLVIAGAVCAQTPVFNEREVAFKNGAIELKGTLLVPTAKGPHPAVVFLHGSGDATRAGARGYAETFAKLGLASLIFDKRGCGASNGSWITSSLDDLAHDALAGVAFVKAQPDIDSNRIGFWGVSQAGWVATLAASQSGDIAFMVVISGGGATPRESEVFSYDRAMTKEGFSEAEKAEAFGVIEQYFNYLATGEGRAAMVTRLEAVKQTRLSPLAGQLEQILPSDENRPNWSWVATWDPVPSIAKVRCPVLLMFGDRDNNHPTEIAVTKWRDGLKQAGNENVTVMVFPGAGHGIRMRDSHTGKGRAPFADGYEDAMVGWVWRHVVAVR